MAIGERIHHFRLLRGFTQKYLGQQLGFSESQADVRIAQYEKGARSPKENFIAFGHDESVLQNAGSGFTPGANSLMKANPVTISEPRPIPARNLQTTAD